MPNKPIRLALLGAGIFARDAHAPALRTLHNRYRVAVIYSRTLESARKLAAAFPYAVETSTDLDEVLARADIDAVDIVLPIDLIPPTIERALAAGKHVISEKPAAPDLATGLRLLDTYEQYPDQLWMVGENWRYEAAFRQAAQLLTEGIVGRVTLVNWTLHTLIDASKPYFHTAWRQTPGYQGGYLLDAGVHHVAALRLLFGEVARVNALAALVDPALPPLDTISASLQFDTGLIASYAATFAAPPPSPSSLNVIGDMGALRIDRARIEIIRRDGDVEHRPIAGVSEPSINAMLADFAAVLNRDVVQVIGTPAQGVQDLAVMEAMLRSAAEGRTFEVERIV